MGFRMPAVEIGQIVLWYAHADTNVPPLAGLVTQVNPGNVHLNCADVKTYNFLVRDGVKHVNDPSLRETERKEQGGWDYTPRDKLINELLGGQASAAPQAGEPASRPRLKSNL
jgi:hypothetical protein